MAEFRDHEQASHDHDHGVDRRAGHHESDHEADHDGGAGLASQLGNQQVNRVLASGMQRDGATGAQQLDEAVARSIEDRRGGGSPLDDGVRGQMEDALGQDLSDVRVHTDSAADQLNQSVSARAFTTGNDVFFSQGTYDPGSSSGRELLGHELTHVVQQRAGASGLDSGEVSHPSDPAEQHAAAVGREVGAATSAPAQAAVARHAQDGAPDAPVARDELDEEEGLQASRDTVVAREGGEEEEEMMG